MRLGTDIVEVGRIGELMQRHGQFKATVFTAAEIAYCESRRRASEHYAARFAVKESVMKALGRGWLQGIEWTDIELGRADSGEPFIEVRGSAAAAMRQLGIASFSVSLSHCTQYATAVVVALQGEEGNRH
jgi:holo-[acyl-carrier protein] synthase